MLFKINLFVINVVFFDLLFNNGKIIFVFEIYLFVDD